VISRQISERLLVIADDMWGDVTFASYLPVFNIWALYEESAETGIGVNSQPRDTAYRLYRDGTQLRGIFPGNAQGARKSPSQAAVWSLGLSDA